MDFMPRLNQTMTIKASVLKKFCLTALKKRGVRQDVARHVTDSLMQASLRGVDSHGLELLPHYLWVVNSGRINPNPKYRFEKTAAGTGRLDADHTFGHAAGAEAMKHAIRLAKKAGVGAVSVYHSSHFGAAAYFSLMAANQNMIGLSFTHSDSLMLSYNGMRSFFGTNPICFAAPVAGEEPFCLDMATSLTNWNKILRSRLAGRIIPPDWGCDASGRSTTDAQRVKALFPIGGYKGFGLAMMVEIFSGVLSGMPIGRDICSMYKDSLKRKRLLGHFFMAIDIRRFVSPPVFKKRMKFLMANVRREPAKDRRHPVMVPGDPEKKTAKLRLKNGIPVSKNAFDQFKLIAREIGFPLPTKGKK